MSESPRMKIAILGAGPAGLGAAWQLAKQDKAEVVVLEQQSAVGGNAGSFELAGVHVDFGSHRLHPSCELQIMADIQGLLGDDLLIRPRHGRIRLRGKWIHFPLKAMDLLTHLPWSFRFGVARDALMKAVPGGGGDADPTFASVLQAGLGATICKDFYFPYARKIWGAEPEELSPIQAQRRVAAGSLMKMVRKVLGLKTGTSSTGRHFYYPRYGYGQISTAISDAMQATGAELRLGARVTRIVTGDRQRVELERDGEAETIEADAVWSTIPLAVLARLVDPPAPEAVLDAAGSIESRAMILIYLVLDTDQFSEFDAHYFPDSEIGITRMSEQKNYSDRGQPAGTTVLCGELPCQVDDATWRMDDASLGDLMLDALARCELRVGCAVREVVTRRLAHAYPIYRRGYEWHFATLDAWAEAVGGVLTFGRQGLFAHDNTHHALAMAYAAVECLDGGAFDADRWADYRRQFESHVVED